MSAESAAPSRPLRVACLPVAEENPYQRLLAEGLAAEGVTMTTGPLHWRLLRSFERVGGGDVLHLHWLAPLLVDRRPWLHWVKLLVFCASVSWLRLRGVRIVWTVHNLFAHERHYLRKDRFLRKFMGRIAHALIVHCEAAREEVVRAYGLRRPQKVWVVPHGHYVGVYPDEIDRAAARAKLDLPDGERVFLFLGQIRAYKNVPALIDTFSKLEGSARLVVAGKARPEELAGEIERLAAADPRIDLRLGFVADEDMQHYVKACDVYVFPYRDILTSGGLVLAMSFGRACLAPRLGCIGEILDAEGGFPYDPDEPEGLLGALRAASDTARDVDAMGRVNRARIEAFPWELVARKTAAVYR